MARKGRVDRGLLPVKNTENKVVSWRVRLYHEGRERRFGPFPTKTQAREFYNKAKHDQRERRFFPERHQQGQGITVEDMIDRYLSLLLSSEKSHRAQQSEYCYARWWKSYLKGTSLRNVTPAILDEAMRSLATHKKGIRHGTSQLYAPQTILHYMKFLRQVLNLAIRDEKLERNPFARITLPKVTTGRTRFLSPEEEIRLSQALGPRYAPWARLAILTGLRKTEMFSLQWPQVNWEQGLITLPQTKSGQIQHVPLNEEAKQILRSFESWHFSKWIFTSRNPTTHLDSGNFYNRVFVPAVKKAHLDDVTWHTLRHTFASRLAMSGQTPNIIAALLRHQSLELVQRYAHLSPSYLKSAVETVASFGKAHPQKSPVKPLPPQNTFMIPTVTKTVMEESEKSRARM